jgi:hypothetical protein
VKTVQSLLRHANSNITMNIYTHAVDGKKREAQSRVVEDGFATSQRAANRCSAGGTA